MGAPARSLRNNGLSIAFGVLFLAALAGQALAGHAEFNEEQSSHGLPGIGLGSYLMSSQFAVDVVENWRSEYLQFFLYVYATVWLLQLGSPESKPAERMGDETDPEQEVGRWSRRRSPPSARARGARRKLFSVSLGLVMGTIFLASWGVQAWSGWSAYNYQQVEQHHRASVGFAEYLTSGDFWSRTSQNWQSEFLAVGSMAVFSVYLRQRGSPESKPVGAPHSATEESG
ncbi:hypothetical protein A8924_5899 [Saccharopolyspora erythraea NRRL 2338]|uniref:Uncharacterized protein n=2 Tax=Saccharopolyspora erythraea TaxID=1836 RepID=A4FL21_SACEN|nr:DUF6766 family protein [Saccharopolyspora erythraea]EQD81917.1 membrane protein [Saccharopolyspora erythraea D]PFG98386.1 hypothetical protein A8924_5899 [Saccharopolyspora erythraea NRRL 2338]QRK88456.1 hypothetical protein JQX30_27880 [Saccharopolyspora erythraea]CAM04746.1 hypothetical protein SACE_5560 [Saccharopolyspora erythraea NRRL 2338]